jgi:hypothetical protein
LPIGDRAAPDTAPTGTPPADEVSSPAIQDVRPIDCEDGPAAEAAADPATEQHGAIPQSTDEVAPLPAGAESEARPFGRRPWTSLFRLIAGDAGRSARGETGPLATQAAVSVEAPAAIATEPALAEETADPRIPVATLEIVPAEAAATIATDPAPAEEPVAADIPLAPDQLERDIAEIELVRDRLLSEAERTDEAPEATAPRSRTSDLVPILVGGALGFILLVVFGAAASFVSLR